MRFAHLIIIMIYMLSHQTMAAISHIEPEVSNSALVELIGQNPSVSPGDQRDLKKPFAELVASYLNPGLNIAIDEKTGVGVTHMSYSTNACTTFENNTIYSLYNCSFTVGYANSVQVNQFNRIDLDLASLLSSGVVIEYEYKVINSKIINSQHKKQIIEPTYFIY